MIYKIRVILDAEEDIFRDIEISATQSLEEFHNAVTQAFGFTGDEMASFYTCDEEWKQDEEIPLFDMGENSATRLMAETSLYEVLTEESPKMLYVYDYFTMWTFFVELADVVAEEPGVTYPNLLFSFGELPDAPPPKQFDSEASSPEEPEMEDLNGDFQDYDDMDFDENWN